jgi:uncharacterized lipoprotein YmbA
MRLLLVLSALWLTGCAEPPHVGVTISNSPEPIESCGSKIGRC